MNGAVLLPVLRLYFYDFCGEPMANIILHTENLSKQYGEITAVSNLTLDVYEGEVFGFLGPNGAGKTTSINMMCGLLPSDAGHVTIHGKSLHNDPNARTRVGVCPQEIVIWERLTCREQLQFMGQMYNLSQHDARQRTTYLLQELDLSEKQHKQARTLSGGMKRRLNIALALVHNPDIVVLDEPEAGLDPQSRVKIRAFIQSLARQKTVILTTHNMDEAERLADRVAIIDHGQLLVLDTPTALKQQVGAGDVVEISLHTPVDEAAEAHVVNLLAHSGNQVWLDDTRQILNVRALHAVGRLAAILTTLTEANVQPGDVRVRENTLEDVFIQLTGRRLRE